MICERHRALDINRLHRAGCLNDGSLRAWKWFDEDGNCTGQVGIAASGTDVIVSYKDRVDGGTWVERDYTMAIDRTACALGGSRPWFLCWSCNRRVGKMFITPKGLVCRHCGGLTYASQRERELDRAHRRCIKLRRRLRGALGELQSPPPARPKGMWSRTYKRLCQRLHQAESDAGAHFSVAMLRRPWFRHHLRRRGLLK